MKMAAGTSGGRDLFAAPKARHSQRFEVGEAGERIPRHHLDLVVADVSANAPRGQVTWSEIVTGGHAFLTAAASLTCGSSAHRAQGGKRRY